MSLTVANPPPSRVEPETTLLTFDVGGVAAAVDIRLTHEIDRNVNIARVPHAPAMLAGVVNLRGQIVSLVDLAVLLGRPRCKSAAAHALIVSSDDRERLGLLVDRVVDVVTMPTKRLTPRPANIAGDDARFYSHVVTRECDLLFVLDLAKVANHLHETIFTAAQAVE